MDILFLTPQLPFPPRQGTAIRNWGLIQHLAARHAITLLSFAETDQSADTPELRAACRRMVVVPAPRRSRAARLRTLLSRHADLARRLWSPDFARACAGLLLGSTFDIVHIEGFEMATYVPLMRGANRASLTPNLRLIYDAHNAEYVLQRRAFATDLRQPARWAGALYSWIQIPRIGEFEAEACRAADSVTCVSEEDALALRQLVPTLQPIVIPNGINLEDYTLRDTPYDTGPTAKATLVFSGKMDFRPNIDAALWFAAEIWPRIRAARPEVQWVIVGQKPVERLLRLNGQDGLVITGAVEDVRPLIAGAAVYVAPLRMGGGTRFKLLEAMALARPIVSTTVGAEGFAVASGRELLLADSPADFAAAVISLLADPARAAALGRAGRAFVQARHDWSAIIPKLERVYESKRAEET